MRQVRRAEVGWPVHRDLHPRPRPQTWYRSHQGGVRSGRFDPSSL